VQRSHISPFASTVPLTIEYPPATNLATDHGVLSTAVEPNDIRNLPSISPPACNAPDHPSQVCNHTLQFSTG